MGNLLDIDMDMDMDMSKKDEYRKTKDIKTEVVNETDTLRQRTNYCLDKCVKVTLNIYPSNQSNQSNHNNTSSINQTIKTKLIY